MPSNSNSIPDWNAPDDTAWEFVLTVSESKRLIAKGLAAEPSVRWTLENGTVVITKGTTNAYVAEELLGHPIPKRGFVYGRNVPASGHSPGFFTGIYPEVIIRRGEHLRDVGLMEILPELKPGDIVMKGANALDYANRVAAVLIGDPSGGTVGKIIGHVYGKGLQLIIPVGLEKQIAMPLTDDSEGLSLPFAGRAGITRLWPLRGWVFTELQALATLAPGVYPVQIGSGGLCGAEGGNRFVIEGPEEDVARARQIIESIQGEPPFGELEE